MLQTIVASLKSPSKTRHSSSLLSTSSPLLSQTFAHYSPSSSIDTYNTKDIHPFLLCGYTTAIPKQNHEQCRTIVVKRFNQTAATQKQRDVNKQIPKRQPYINDPLRKPRNDNTSKTAWVSFQDTISKFSSLSDLLQSIENTMNHIKSEKDLPLDTENNYPDHLVLDARIQLSNLKRFHGWYLRFPSHIVAQSLVDYYEKERRSELEQQAYNNRNDRYSNEQRSCYILPAQEVIKNVPESVAINLDESVLRLEHMPKQTTLVDLYHLLRHWEFNMKVDKPIVPLQDICRYHVKENTYILYMADAANARSVVRELQFSDFNGHTLLFTRYPDQLISGSELLM